jgi:hypothetical protein
LPVEFARPLALSDSSFARDDKNTFRRPSIIIPITAKMADAQVTLRTRKFIRNPLLARKQMVV